MSEPLWTTEQLALYLNVTAGTIRKWRMTGSTPPEIRVNGAIRYAPEVVREWVKERAEREK